MKIICELEKIKKAVASLTRISTKKEFNENLSSIFFEVKENVLVIRATNLSVGAEYSIPIEIKNDKEGEKTFCLNAQNTQNIFSALIVDKNQPNIEIEVEENTLLIVYKKNKLHINKQESGEIPTLPFIKEEGFVIDKNILKEGIQITLSTSSKSDIKPELASVFINQQEGKLVFVTTDTFRLTEYFVKTTNQYSFPGILIPTKNAQEIYKILDDSTSNEVEVYPTKNQITFITKDVFVTSQLINGVFPDYTKIIPTLKHNTTTVLKSDIMDVLKTLNPFLDIRSQIKINIDQEKQEISFYCKNETSGEYSGSVSAKVVGDSFELLLNKTYLEDVLQKMSDVVVFIINQQQKPILVQSENNKDITCLLMPMSQ